MGVARGLHQATAAFRPARAVLAAARPRPAQTPPRRANPISTPPACSYNDALLERLRAEKRGRSLLLVTASDAGLAQRVSDHLGIFDAVLGSDVRHFNLRGAQKAAALVARFGDRGFDYVGDSRADLPVWAKSREAWLAGASASVARSARKDFTVRAEFPRPAGGARAVGRVLRPHQWVKNLIVLVPLVTSHQLARPAGVRPGLLAFVAFCLCASGVYVLNDILDVEADRLHPAKRLRPLAAGQVRISWAFSLGPLLLAGGFALAASASPGSSPAR